MNEELRNQLLEITGGHLLQFYDGYDDAIIGVGFQYSGPPVVVYDRTKVLAICMKINDWDEDEAWEYLAHNTFYAWIGPQTPIFLDRPQELE